MARKRRFVIPDNPHHVTHRGVRKIPIFLSDEDRIEYLEILSDMGEKHGVVFGCWCLMNNHIHIIAIPKEEGSLSKAIGITHQTYTQRFNRKYDFTGDLFSQRFFSTPMDEIHTFTAICYVHRNPVRAGIVKKASDYKWSSARYFLRQQHFDMLVNDHLLLESQASWLNMFDEPVPEEKLEKIRMATSTGNPFANEGIISKWGHLIDKHTS